MTTDRTGFTRRTFLRSTAALAAFATVGRPAQSLFGEVATAATSASTSESLVKLLFESLKPEQKKQICFPATNRKFYFWMKFTDSIKRSRIFFYHM